jgi:hypothetical protein
VKYVHIAVGRSLLLHIQDIGDVRDIGDIRDVSDTSGGLEDLLTREIYIISLQFIFAISKPLN